jgi:hypothetical protein
MTEWFNVSGLVLNIVGTGLLLRFGLPPDVSPNGNVYLVAEQPDQAEVRKGARYKRYGRAGMVLLLVGFILQLLGAVLH